MDYFSVVVVALLTLLFVSFLMATIFDLPSCRYGYHQMEERKTYIETVKYLESFKQGEKSWSKDKTLNQVLDEYKGQIKQLDAFIDGWESADDYQVFLLEAGINE